MLKMTGTVLVQNTKQRSGANYFKGEACLHLSYLLQLQLSHLSVSNTYMKQYFENCSVKDWLQEISADKFQSPVDENSLVLTKSHSSSDY